MRQLLNGFRVAIVSSVAIALIAACSKESGSGDASQVAAKVNSSEVTVHQLNQELQAAAGSSQEFNKDAATPVLLERLINQQLLVEKAKESKLDRNANVMQAIERSKNQIMAQAYLEGIFASLPEPNDNDITKYYDENPELFKNRKVYQLQEFVFEPTTDRKLVEQKVKDTKSLKEFVDWANKSQLKANSRVVASAAERIPFALLPILAKLPDNRGIFLSQTNPTTVLWKVGAKDVPVNFEQSKPFIKQFLIKQKRETRAQEEIEKLRASAKIEYKGEFGKPAADVSTSTEALPLNNSSSDKKDNATGDRPAGM